VLQLPFQEMFSRDFPALIKPNGLLSCSSGQLVSGPRTSQLNSIHVSTSCPSMFKFNYIIQFTLLCQKWHFHFVTMTKILTIVFMSLQSPSPSRSQRGP
jgi:hypothetical protein